MTSAMDDAVGRVLAALRDRGIEENTLLFFLSDNGGPTSQTTSSNLPLRGYKGQVLEGGIRVPFLVQWPERIPSGKTFRDPVISLDIMGTITALAGVEIDEDRPLDGVNLVPYLTGEKKGPPHEVLFWRKWEQKGMAIRSGDMKLVSNGQRQKNNYAHYNLSKDVGESNNRKDKSRKETKALIKDWEAWNAELKDRIFPTLMEDKWWEKN